MCGGGATQSIRVKVFFTPREIKFYRLFYYNYSVTIYSVYALYGVEVDRNFFRSFLYYLEVDRNFY